MNTKTQLLKTLIREEIKKQLNSRRLNEAETPEESLMRSFEMASDSNQMDFLRKLNTIAKVLKPTGYLNGTVVKKKGNEIIVVVPLPEGMTDIPEMLELHDMGVVSFWGSPSVRVLDKYKFEIHNPSGGFYSLKDGVSLLQLIKLL